MCEIDQDDRNAMMARHRSSSMLVKSRSNDGDSGSSSWTGWIIVKASRDGAGRTYDGPSWDQARIREQRQAVYDDRELALRHAKQLTSVNAVGFVVVPAHVVVQKTA